MKTFVKKHFLPAFLLWNPALHRSFPALVQTFSLPKLWRHPQCCSYVRQLLYRLTLTVLLFLYLIHLFLLITHEFSFLTSTIPPLFCFNSFCTASFFITEAAKPSSTTHKDALNSLPIKCPKLSLSE